MAEHMLGAIEAGGTKFVLGLAQSTGADAAGCPRIVARHRIATTTPEITLSAAMAWFAQAGVELAAIGIGAFGPLQLTRGSPDWGHLRATPKPGWSGVDLVAPFARAFGCPVEIETDVNAAALAEARWGAGATVEAAGGRGGLLYLTVGTGVGGGYVGGDGLLLHGIAHPEMGHMRVPRHANDRDFAGICPFHGDCLEGLASGPAIAARWGASLSQLGPDHPGLAIIGWYLGQAVVNFQAMLAPARIVLGGGVMATPGLLSRVRDAAVVASGGYFAGDAQVLVVAPGLGIDSGLLGAAAVAQAALAHA